LDDDSLLDFSDEHSSIAEAMQTSHDVRLRVETPPTSSRLLGQQLHEVALRAASCLGSLSLPLLACGPRCWTGSFMLAPPRQFPAASPFSRRCTRNCRQHGRYPTRAEPRCRGSRPTCSSTGLRRGATSPSLRWRMQTC